MRNHRGLELRRPDQPLPGPIRAAEQRHRGGPISSIQSKKRLRRTLRASVPAAMLLSTAGAVLAAPPASADTPSRTYLVNSTGDGNDLNPLDGGCDANLDPAVFECTLRAALEEANTTTQGRVSIVFDIPGSGSVRVIAPHSPLPEITTPVTIDGYTQPGSRPNTRAVGTDAVLTVELTGLLTGGLSGGNGLTIAERAAGSVIRGLALNRFNTAVVLKSPFNTIAGNFIGTNVTGTAARSNRGGVTFSAGSPVNFTTIGGTAPADRNIISANVNQGVVIPVGHHDNAVVGNLIGTDRSGTAPLGNGHGVSIDLGLDNVIGGTTPGAANTIAFNHGDGVRIGTRPGGTGNRVSGNSIFANDGAGIVGVGNAPTITAAKTTDGRTTITGTLSSTPNRIFSVELFSSPPGREDEGQTFLGARAVTTDGSGKASFSFTTAAAVPGGHSITATASSAGLDTSSFSAPRTVAPK